MSVPVLTCFNNKGGVGTTSLVYHLAWMLSELGYCVLACDVDPQANLTAAFLEELDLEKLWDDGQNKQPAARTIMQCIEPLMHVQDIRAPEIVKITPYLHLVPGDLALAGFEDTLSVEWSNTLSSTDLYRSFRVLTAFSTVMQNGAAKINASIILVDVGPNLGAINRSALIATDFIIVPLGTDLFSLQGLRNLGPTLNKWRSDWKKRKEHWKQPEFSIPQGAMKPIGYVVQQHGVRLERPIKVCDKWVNKMPTEYAQSLLNLYNAPYPKTPTEDKQNALATAKHYRGLVPIAQEVRKPIFHLKTADGAIGAHAAAVNSAYQDFKILAEKIVKRTGIKKTDTVLW